MDIRTLGIDLAKNVFQVHDVDGKGRTVVQRQFRRRQLLPFIAQLQPCLVAMEACGSAHYWAREIAPARSPGQADESAVRAAVREVEQE
jgi:transposase